jgi:hypothetical protein
MGVYFIRTYSKPTEKVSAIYRILEMKEAPFVRKKSVVHKSKLKKNTELVYRKIRGDGCNVG